MKKNVPSHLLPHRFRRQARRARVMAVGAAVAGSLSGRPALAQQTQAAPPDRVSQPARATFSFTLPEDTIAAVLAEFAKITGLRVLLATQDLGIVMSPGVRGTMTAPEAMAAILMGTSLQARFLYEGGQAFGSHVDNAIRYSAPAGLRVRTDLSATLFLAPREEYDGGELIIEDTYGVHAVKLPAGHLVLYPSTSLHRVAPVTRGARVSSFFWVQSMVRDDGARTLLFDLDTAIQRLSGDTPDHPAVLQLTGVYHNLLRRWAEV